MRAFTLAFGATALAITIGAGLVAQQPQEPHPTRSEPPRPPDPSRQPTARSIRCVEREGHGAIYSAKGLLHDPVRNLIVV